MATSKEYTILFCCTNSTFSASTFGLPMKYFNAVMSHEFDRRIMPEYEEELDALWQKKLSENSNIYNASKFRLNSFTEESDHIKLEFGLTCYKDFQCTNMQSKESVKMLHDYGLRNYDDVNACMANPMFSTAIVVSSDNYVVMFKRSDMVGESPGMVDFPGGHMEPSDIDKDDILENMCGDDVVKEFFYSALREARDEVNLPESSLSWPCLLGILRNNKIGGKPGACFYMRCTCTSEEIKLLYEKGGSESYESTEVILIQMKELFQKNSTLFPKLLKNMTVSAHAALELLNHSYEEQLKFN
ncbi:uridine diphosphate glucose pyrophosphatase-like [Dendronephthya gigantea]|uniref:uridine diphosphate glucose pyrophosphatase-like n=1 Tax=Dendronephthya gigantea TaxID=151771 RepID=UPI0010699E8D|nr:uridine diphosphate glucose pyrophosphatase-like [Dendronephthya gigantea]